MGNKNTKLNLGGISFTSEWMEYQLLEALFNDKDISKKFSLSWVSGKESNFQQVEKRILEEVIGKSTELEETIGTPSEWRVKNTITESRNLLTLLEKINTKEVGYYQMNRRGNDIPKAAYDDLDLVAIFAINALHIDYIEDAIYHNVHILCEKPLAVVTDITGKADRRSLDRLIELDDSRKKKGLIVMDAEHYSSKIAAKVFFDHIKEMADKYGKITEVRGYLEEKDNPEKTRTRDLLCLENQTGLLLDTGVHLLSMITGIGGDFGEVQEAKYGMHSKYDVETAADVELGAKGEYFSGKVPVYLKVGKFINQYEQPKDEEKKQVEFTFEKNEKKTTVTVNFKTGKVTDTTGENWHEKPHIHSPVEYVNILNELYSCIQNRTDPRTKLSNTIKILDAIFRTHEKFPVSENLDKGWYR